MPTRPPRVCPRCQNVVDGPCRTCSRQRDADAQRSVAWKGGSTRAWRRFRRQWLDEHPFCAGWPLDTCSAIADQVDHIKPLALFTGARREAARFSRRNVQSLCSPCHKRKTAHDRIVIARAREADEEAVDGLW